MKRHTVRIVLMVPVHPPSYSLYATHTYGTTFWNSSRVSCVNTSVTCYLDCSAPCFVLFCLLSEILEIFFYYLHIRAFCCCCYCCSLKKMKQLYPIPWCVHAICFSHSLPTGEHVEVSFPQRFTITNNAAMINVIHMFSGKF